MPIFSVILPTHNRAQLLPRAIQSVLNQTFSDFELIIVDDASTDNTPEVVKSFQDDRLIYARRKESGCAAAARNSGIMRAKGKYISFLDDDDEYLPEFLERTYHVLNPSPKSVGFAWCGVRKVKDTTSGEILVKEISWENAVSCGQKDHQTNQLHYLKSATGYGLTIRKDCFQIVGFFDETIKGIEDTDLLIRLGRHFGYVTIPQILVKIHLHDGPQLTNITPQRAEAYERLVNKNIDFIKSDAMRWMKANRKLAALFYQSGNKSKGRKTMMNILLKHPVNLKLWKSFFCFEIWGTEQLGLRQIFSFSRS